MDYTIPSSSFLAARTRIAPYIRHTPILPNPCVMRDVPPNVSFKLENLQVSGSFKARGVFNTLLQLDEGQKGRGVITASGGNHGVALAYAAHRLGISATVYLPERATKDRIARIAFWGATVITHGAAWDDANAKALQHAGEENLAYVHPFASEPTVEGQGTLGIEVLDDLPELDCLIVAVGGGGLISGVAAAAKQLKPDVHVIGVEPTGAASMFRSYSAGRLEPLGEVRTIADTLATRSVSERTLFLSKTYVNEFVQVDDQSMVRAMRWLWGECNQLVEPAGAAAVAALLDGVCRIDRFRHPVAIVCGGNAGAESVFASYQKAAELVAGVQ